MFCAGTGKQDMKIEVTHICLFLTFTVLCRKMEQTIYRFCAVNWPIQRAWYNFGGYNIIVGVAENRLFTLNSDITVNSCSFVLWKVEHATTFLIFVFVSQRLCQRHPGPKGQIN
jgi:hypothetical protein